MTFDRKEKSKDIVEKDEEEEQLQVIDGGTNMEYEQKGMIIVEDEDRDGDDDGLEHWDYIDLI